MSILSVTKVFLYSCLLHECLCHSQHDAYDDQPNIIMILLDDLGYADVGFTQTEEYHNDETIYFKTPFIDSLALDEGIILSRYYVHPLCSPTRAAFLTGRYPFRYSMELFVTTLATNTLTKSDNAGVTNLNIGTSLLPSILSNYGGYRTLLSGKWHVGRDSWSNTPAPYFDEWVSCINGFLDYYTHKTCNTWSIPSWNSDILDISDDLYDQLTDKYPLPDGLCFDGFFNGINSTYHDRSTYNNDIYVEDIYLDTILSFIQRGTGGRRNKDRDKKSGGHGQGSDSGEFETQQGRDDRDSSSGDDDDDSDDEPFFIFWSASTPHWPILDPPNDGTIDYSECDNIINDGRLSLCKMLQYMDNKISILVNELKDKNLWDNTLIIFSSDNGGEPSNNGGSDQFYWFGNGFASNLPLRGRKRSAFEGGVHSPAFITGGYLPKSLRGSTYNNLMAIEDWYSTFINIADINIESINELTNVTLNSFNMWNNIIDSSSYSNSNSADGDGDTNPPRTEWVQCVSSCTETSCIITQDGWKYVINGGGSSASYDGYFEFNGNDSTADSFINASEHTQYMLFDILNDKSETNNLYLEYDDYIDIINELEIKLLEYGNQSVFFGVTSSLNALKSDVDTGKMQPWLPKYENVNQTAEQILQPLLDD